MFEEPELHLIEFYGTECTHCRKMEPLVEHLEMETNLINKLEVWHNEATANLMREYDNGHCGGVPFFFNKKSGEWLCGAHDYETLKIWTLGHNVKQLPPELSRPQRNPSVASLL